MPTGEEKLATNDLNLNLTLDHIILIISALTIQQRTTRQIGIHHPMRRAPFLLHITPEARISHRPKHLANLPAANNLAHLHTQREIASPDRLHQEKTLLASCVTQNLGLRRINSKRLFAEYVLAGVQGQHDVLVVVRVRSGNVDYVDVGVCDEVFVVGVGGAGLWDFHG